MRRKVKSKIKAELQKECNSECPFCGDQNVGCFEIHHIDHNSSNSLDPDNLLLLCPTCHTKVEKGYISYEAVVTRKEELKHRSWKVEFVAVSIDPSVCKWSVSRHNDDAFFNNGTNPSALILNFAFINHLPKILVLSKIEVAAKWLYSGMSGPPREARRMIPKTKYRILLPHEEENKILKLHHPLEVPPSSGFNFQLEILETDSRFIVERVIVYLSFYFSQQIIVRIPSIFLNTDNENEGVRLLVLS